jgi:ubiquinone/menaquinone biosynthesis C-methylase UbiE
VIEAFTDMAPHYEESMERELHEIWAVGYRDFVERLVQGVQPGAGARILDVATGTAMIPRQVARRMGPGCRIVGLDITAAMLAGARARVQQEGLARQVQLVCASGMALPFGRGTFDLVICALGMHHMQVPTVLAEMGRVLKEGGQVLITCVSAPAFWRTPLARLLLGLAARLYSLTHHSARSRAEVAAVPTFRTLEEWQELCAALGFVQIEAGVAYRRRRFWYPDAFALRAVRGAAAAGPP